MCFGFGSKPRSGSKYAQTRKTYGSSSRSRSRNRSNPFSHHTAYEKERAREFERLKNQAYQDVYSDIDHVKELQERLNTDGRWKGGGSEKSVVEIANEAAAAAVKKEREERVAQKKEDLKFEGLKKMFEDDKKTREERDRSAKEQRFERWAKQNEEREQREEVNREIEDRTRKTLNGDAKGREGRENIDRQIEEGVRKGFEGLNCVDSAVPNNHNCGPHYGFYGGGRYDRWNGNGHNAGSDRGGGNGGNGNGERCIGGGGWNDWNALPGPYRQGLLGGATTDLTTDHRINMLELKFELEKTKNEIRGSMAGHSMGRMWP
jgi:hypothetical protein